MKKWGVLLLLGSVCMAASFAPVTPFEKMHLPLETGKLVLIGNSGWKMHCGNVDGFEKTDFDDSAWLTGKVDLPAIGQKMKGSHWVLYRKTFDVPETMCRKPVVLDLGYVSFYDEVYLNGVKIGSFGSQPKPVEGSSWVRRCYPLVGKNVSLLKPGRNLIAVRTYTGYASGMYNGSPSVAELTQTIYPRFRMKEPGSLQWNLSDAEHLNRYRPGETAVLSLALTSLAGDRPVELTAVLCDGAGKELAVIRRSVTLPEGMWCYFNPMKFQLPKEKGKFTVRLLCTDKQKNMLAHWDLKGMIADKEKYSLPVDEKLASRDFPIDVSSLTEGHFGPRHFKEGKLVDDFSIPDARGTLAYSVRPAPDAPLIFQTNLRRMPKNAPAAKTLLAAKGKEYDGLKDAWVFGKVTVPGAGKLNSVSASGDWSRKRYSYRYQDLRQFDFQISTIQPAWKLTTSGKTLRVFDGVEEYGAGLPTLLVLEQNGKAVSLDPAKETDLSQMSANWFMAAFPGAAGYSGFDVPWLFVLQHRPRSVKNNAGALELTFAKEAGTVYAMPLYGVTLLPQSETQNWRKELPETVVKRCRRWSRILASAPETLARSAAVDYPADLLCYRDTVTHYALNDDWGTVGEKIVPVPPILPPTFKNATRFKGSISRVAEDLEYSTLHGPLFAAQGTELVTGLRGLLHFVTEVRTVQVRNAKEDAALRQKLNDLLRHGTVKYLSAHPWKGNIWREKYVPGNQEEHFSNILLALPYAEANVAAKVRAAYKEEVEKYLLYDALPDESLSKLLLPKLRNRPVTIALQTTSGRKIRTFAPQETDYGIDSGCFESLLCYMLWDYARCFDGWKFIQKNWSRILESAYLIPHAHSWPIGVSYDTFSGIRVGNGLQETGIMHAGMCAVARMAHQLGDKKLRDSAAYFAAMQLVGLQGALSMNRYLRENRPVLPENSCASEVEFCEYHRPYHYVEFNENGGFTQNVMLCKTLLNSWHSFIMTPLPEVMRPYKELFPELTNDFFDPKYRFIPFNRTLAEAVSPDARVYMLTRYPVSVFELRQKHSALPIPWMEQLNDMRADLDSRGKIQYKKLW